MRELSVDPVTQKFYFTKDVSFNYGTSIKEIEKRLPNVKIIDEDGDGRLSPEDRTIYLDEKPYQPSLINYEKQKQINFLSKINNFLNIPYEEHKDGTISPYYETGIKEENNKKFLVLSRPANSEYNNAIRNKINLAAIKSNLFIKDGILGENNNLEFVTGRRKNFDDGTIDPGKELLIPLDAIGQKFSFIGSNKELLAAVAEYLR